MGSSADRQAITLLAVCKGHLVYLQINGGLGKMLDKMIDNVVEHLDTALEDWPAKFSNKQLEDLETMINTWGGFIDEHVREGRMVFLVSVSTHCLDDLNDMVTNNTKKKLIAPVFEPLQKLVDKIDPVGRFHEDYENVRGVLKELYSKVGFPLEYVN